MKEIDFLPEWYRSGRRREAGYRTQYIALGAIFVMMVTWNTIATRSISKATAELAKADSQAADIEKISLEFNKIQSQLTTLKQKAQTIEGVDSKIDVAAVLAEISFLINRKIVLSKVELIAEDFVGGRNSKSRTGSIARVAGGNFARTPSSQMAADNDVRFKVLIGGIAADAGNVAELVCRLEDSPYFHQVYLLFSRSKEIKTKTNQLPNGPVEANVSEFEIGCYLANYRRQ